MLSHTADARALLQQYVQTLHENVYWFTYGRVYHRFSDTRVAFLPRETWIVLPIRIIPAEAYTANVRAMRAFVEVVGRLSACADFGLRDFYHGFWKSALFDELKRGPPRPAEYDDPAQLLSVQVAQAPRFLLDLLGGEVTSAHVALLREFFEVDPVEALGLENDALLSRLTASAISGVTATAGRVPVVEIGLGSNNAIDSDVLQELCQLANDVQQLQLQQHQPYSRHVTLDLSTLWMEKLVLSTSTDLIALTNVAANPRSSIRHLKLPELIVEADKRADDMKAAFQNFTRAILYDKGREGAPSTTPLRSLLLSRTLISHHEFVDMCSALRYSTEIRELNVHMLLGRMNLAEQDRDWHVGWAWLAFAVLHPDSNIRLDRLDISSFPIEAKNMELVAEIISSVRPGRRLWELQHGPLPSADDHPAFEEIDLPADQRFFVTLPHNNNEDAKILSRPKSEAPVLFTIKDTTEQFEVLLLLSDWVCVLVSGYGCGWAPSAAIASQNTKPTKCIQMSSSSSSSTQLSSAWPRAGANVKHLERNDEHGSVYDVTPVKQLLHMMGHSLIGLGAEVYAIENADVGEILDACPNLTYLNLDSARLSNISALVDRFRSGKCKITYLDVASEVPDNQIVLQLAELLAEPSGQALLCVCAGGINDQHATNPEPFLALARALAVNQTLWYLRLKCYRLGNSITKQLQDNLLMHERIHRVRNATVGFLSVVTATSGQSSVLRSLDAKMLSLVLDFAGIAIKPTSRYSSR